MDADWGYPILGPLLDVIFMDPIKDVFATPFRFRAAVAKSEASTNFLLASFASIRFLAFDLPSGYVKIAIENGHRNSGFSHETWWLFP